MGRATDYSGESHLGFQSVGRSYPSPLCYLDRLTVLAGNLLNAIDDAAPKLGFVDPHESLCQQEPFGGGEEIRHVGREGASLIMSVDLCKLGAPSKKNATGTCRMWEICCNRLAPMRLVPFSYFCTCWKVRPSASPSFSWLIASIRRRMRTRRPTYLSIGFR